MPGKNIILSATAICLFLFFIIQCGLYAEQNTALSEENEALSATLAKEKLTIADKNQETETLQAQLKESVSIKEYQTDTGFIKKGGVYLIDTESQLLTLQRLIGGCAEIEAGVPAASASYRLRNDLDTGSDWLYLGTAKTPFTGRFDGDGHTLAGVFPPVAGASNSPGVLFHTDASTEIKNLQIKNGKEESIHLSAAEQWECEELEQYLPNFSECSIHMLIDGWKPDVQQIAEILRWQWEQNSGQNEYYVSMTFCPASEEAPANAETYLQKIHTALTTLDGAEYTQIIEDTMTKEAGYLHFVRLERTGGLTCCTFEIRDGDYYYPDVSGDCGYYLILDGTWENHEISKQCLRIPYTFMEHCSVGIYKDYRAEQVDLNFDGKMDLLIHEGYSGGSGGSWDDYRAVVWDEETGQFVYFPSFPEQVNHLEFDRQRVVSHARMGSGYEAVYIYEMVDGEYECTKELATSVAQDGEGNTEIRLTYYEMDVPVETHVLSDVNERETLYPDLDYWRYE